jgi:hypothetical protein
MDTNQFQNAVSGYLEQVRSAAFHEGRIAGRKEARDELRFFFDKFEEAFPIEPVEQRPKKPRKPSVAKADDDDDPPTTVWLSPGEVAPLIRQALVTLQIDHPGGASPQMIAEQVRPNGMPINVQAVRFALRQLTLTGGVRRVAHARYLPGEPEPGAEPQPEAAE